MATEIAQAFVTIIPSMEGAQQTITEQLTSAGGSAGTSAGESFSNSMGGSIKSGASKIVSGLKTVGEAAYNMGKSLYDATSEVAQYGDHVDKMSQKMGVSSTAYQEWDFVLQHSGSSMDSMQSSMKKLATAAETGNAAFEKIGISQKDLAGMSQEQMFGAVISGLQTVESDSERTYLASQLLGKGATELGPLLNMSAEETAALMQQVHDLGGVMDETAIKNAAAFQDSLQNLQTSFRGLKYNLLAEFMPGITNVMDGLTAIFSGDNTKGVGLIREGVSNIAGTITNCLPTFIESVGAIAEGLIAALPEAVSAIAKALPGMIKSLGGAIIKVLPDLIKSIISGFGSLAGELVNGIIGLFTGSGGTNIISGIFNGIKEGFTGVDWSGIGGTLSAGLGKAFQFVGDVINNIFDPESANAPEFNLDTALTDLKTGFDALGAGAAKLVNGIGTSLLTAIDNINWAAIGKTLADGINGVTNYASAFINTVDWTALGTTAGKLVNTVTSTLSSAIDNFDSEAAGKLLASTLNSVVKVAQGFMDATDWAAVGAIPANGINAASSVINSAITSVNWNAIGTLYGTSINSIVSVAQGFVSGVDWNAIGQIPANGINGVVTTINSALKSVNWKGAGELVGESVNGILTSATAFVGGLNWNGIGKAPADAINGVVSTCSSAVNAIDWAQTGTNLGNAVQSYLDAVVKAITIPATIVSGISDWISGLFGGGTAESPKLDTENIKIDPDKLTALKDIATALGTIKTNHTGLTDFANSVNTASTLIAKAALWDVPGKIDEISTSISTLSTDATKNINTFGNTLRVGLLAVSVVVTARMQALKTDFSTGMANIATAMSTGWSTVQSNATSAVGALSGAITGAIGGMVNTVKQSIASLNGVFNSVNWGTPNIRLPHFSLNGSFNLQNNSVPTVSVSWYDRGGVFESPTIIGVGEKRPEFVGALDDLRQIVREETGTQTITMNVYGAEGQSVERLADVVMERMQQAVNRRKAVFA